MDLFIRSISFWPISRFFSAIYEKYYKNKDTSNNQPAISSQNNHFYYPTIVEYLLTYFMPILPLWSDLLFKTIKNDSLIRSNAVVENWNIILKHTRMKYCTKFRPGDFIRKLCSYLKGRV